jgi:hypothetical protein
MQGLSYVLADESLVLQTVQMAMDFVRITHIANYDLTCEDWTIGRVTAYAEVWEKQPQMLRCVQHDSAFGIDSSGRTAKSVVGSRPERNHDRRSALTTPIFKLAKLPNWRPIARNRPEMPASVEFAVIAGSQTHGTRGTIG